MEKKAIKTAAIGLMIITYCCCFLLPRLPVIRTRAIEWQEDRMATAEQEAMKVEMTELEMVDADIMVEEEKRQLRLRLPDGVKGSDIVVTNNYLLQTINIEIPNTDSAYFDNYPITGSSKNINSLSYVRESGMGMIAIEMDRVYELKLEYDEEYYYFDFLTPHEVYDKVVVIDAGHGGRTPGATKNGAVEKEINLDMVLELKEILDASEENIGVYYTRIDDSNPTFEQRVQLANLSDADLFISVHNNSLEKSWKTKGTQVMYSESDTGELTSEIFAGILLEDLTETLESENRGLIEGDDIYIIRNSEVPVALIEVGFLTNKEEVRLLESEEYQQKTAEAIYESILAAFEMGY